MLLDLFVCLFVYVNIFPVNSLKHSSPQCFRTMVWEWLKWWLYFVLKAYLSFVHYAVKTCQTHGGNAPLILNLVTVCGNRHRSEEPLQPTIRCLLQLASGSDSSSVSGLRFVCVKWTINIQQFRSWRYRRGMKLASWSGAVAIVMVSFKNTDVSFCICLSAYSPWRTSSVSIQHRCSYRAIHTERNPYVLLNSRADFRHESSPVHAWWAVGKTATYSSASWDVGHRGRFFKCNILYI
jgi:hypothetical protein